MIVFWKQVLCFDLHGWLSDVDRSGGLCLDLLNWMTVVDRSGSRLLLGGGNCV
jgi:hypothetical protein